MNNKFKNTIVLGGFIIVVLIISFFFQEKEEVIINQETASEDDKNMVEENSIIVYIVGAVHEPGVIKIKSGARLYEALAMIGGLKEDANTEVLNLASVLKDEQKIVIPYITSGDDLTSLTSNISQSFENTSKLININTAMEAELTKLNGIGESTAKKVIEYRNENGYFKDIEDIMNVSGIGQNKFNAIKNDITI